MEWSTLPFETIFCIAAVETWPSLCSERISWHWPMCQERSWGSPMGNVLCWQELQCLQCKDKRTGRQKVQPGKSSYLWDLFKSARNPFDALSLQLSLPASVLFLGNRISPMAEGFLKQKENLEMSTMWIQSFSSLDLHCVGPILRNKLEEHKSCFNEVHPKRRSLTVEVQEKQMSKRCCCEGSVPS